MSTRIMSGPICRIFLNGMTIFGSQFKNPRNRLHPGTMILQIQPLQGSNSRSHTLPSFLQSFILITSLFFNSEKSISKNSLFHCLLLEICRFPKNETRNVPGTRKIDMNIFHLQAHTSTIIHSAASVRKRGRYDTGKS